MSDSKVDQYQSTVGLEFALDSQIDAVRKRDEMERGYFFIERVGNRNQRGGRIVDGGQLGRIECSSGRSRGDRGDRRRGKLKIVDILNFGLDPACRLGFVGVADETRRLEEGSDNVHVKRGFLGALAQNGI